MAAKFEKCFKEARAQNARADKLRNSIMWGTIIALPSRTLVVYDWAAAAAASIRSCCGGSRYEDKLNTLGSLDVLETLDVVFMLFWSESSMFFMF